MGITFIDLFAGIGGFRRGMELSGHRCVGFCEFDRYAVASYTSMHLITDKQRENLKMLPLRKRQKEILKDDYRNGEWYSNDIRRVDAGSVPKADCWCFGAPCQDFSVAGKRAGLKGDRSVLVREVFRILGEIEEESRPEWLIYENVEGMFSSNGGFDFLEILLSMDELGYDCEWQLFNSKYWGVPQNRKRVYTIGHLRRFGTRKILPIAGTDGESRISVIGHRAKFRRSLQTYSAEGIVEALDTAQGGGSGPHVAILCNTNPSGKGMNGNVFDSAGISPSLTTNKGEGNKIAIPVSGDNTKYAIRKLTPKECFRLQGWTDDYYEKAAFTNFDSQLYKQAGNGVTVNVVQAIAEKLN